MLVGVVCLVMRYRQGTEVVRRQLLWLLGAGAVIVVAVTPWALVAGTPIAVLFTIPLLPAAVAVAVLRHQLLDIRLVIARGLTYALLSGLVLAAYAALVIVLSGVASALLVSLLALPVRSRLQTAVDRLFYGERGNPLRVASRVGRSMPGGLAETLAELAEALRLPYVAVLVDGVVVASGGEPEGESATLPLGVDTLVVGLRRGEAHLSPADGRVLALLAGPLSTAVHATLLLEQLQVSRRRSVSAQEQERRRLRRDLHDGLGPLLTGVALSADTASNLAGPSEGTALQERLTAVRRDSRAAIIEVRRIVDNLGSPALDEHGLLHALRLRAAQTTRRSDGSALTTVVEAERDLPALPAEVELATYRIATEALTNVVRHSSASTVVVRLGCDDGLHCEVLDNGADTGRWMPGVGIVGMRERAAELGGVCEVGPGPDGGRVRLSLPVVVG
jgi:signal transduction histidine kinase